MGQANYYCSIPLVGIATGRSTGMSIFKPPVSSWSMISNVDMGFLRTHGGTRRRVSDIQRVDPAVFGEAKQIGIGKRVLNGF